MSYDIFLLEFENRIIILQTVDESNKMQDIYFMNRFTGKIFHVYRKLSIG